MTRTEMANDPLTQTRTLFHMSLIILVENPLLKTGSSYIHTYIHTIIHTYIHTYTQLSTVTGTFV